MRSINGDLVGCLAVPAGFLQHLGSVLFLLLREKRPCSLATQLLLLTPRLLQTLNSVPLSLLPWPLYISGICKPINVLAQKPLPGLQGLAEWREKGR